MKATVGILSLGCARNLVDSEVALGYLKKAGFRITEEIVKADVTLVNTCCFIQEAKEESVNTILELCRLKQEGRVKKIVVMGCLAQRYNRQLIRDLKEVDAFIGVGSIKQIAQVLNKVLSGQSNFGQFAKPQFLYSHLSPRELLTPSHFAYLKIAEGCNNRCSYCIIPRLRGSYRSRPFHSLLKEADLLLKHYQVKELNLIGQDTTMYGEDLYGRKRLPDLLCALSAQARGRWVRLLYTHPGHFSSELIQAVKENREICKYIDLPIQHINDKILKLMNRKISQSQILQLLQAIRSEIPNLAIRTTVIVGFPGETDRQFKELIEFISQARFERLGLFKYSPEADTPAAKFKQAVPEKVKQERYREIMTLQQGISLKINQAFLGRTFEVLIDEQDESCPDQYLARTEYDAPEVDGCVYVKSQKPLKPGDFAQVKIVDTLEYDLVGETG